MGVDASCSISLTNPLTACLVKSRSQTRADEAPSREVLQELARSGVRERDVAYLSFHRKRASPSLPVPHPLGNQSFHLSAKGKVPTSLLQIGF